MPFGVAAGIPNWGVCFVPLRRASVRDWRRRLVWVRWLFVTRRGRGRDMVLLKDRGEKLALAALVLLQQRANLGKLRRVHSAV